MSDYSKFLEPEMPPKEEFFSDLKKEEISDTDYQHACHVFSALNLENLGQYSDVYLKTDVLLLADVFENFRDICLRDYQLDPAHFYSSPGLSFAAMLKMTKVELQLFTDIDQLNMFEKGLRGGLSQISRKYAMANNPYMKDFNPEEPTTYIQYLDANNLYGWALMQKLPMRDFRFLDERELSTFDVNSIDIHGDNGYLIECDLHYDIALHEQHECLPVAPEKRAVETDELSPFGLRLCKELNDRKRPKIEKLITSLYDKHNYVLHSRTLKLYLSLGLKVKKIHRVLQFHQETWMKPYIDFNTSKRALDKTEFEKSFFKLMNNSVFGKLMENQKKHKDIKLVSSEKKLQKLVAKPTFRSRKIFNDTLVGVESKRARVEITKPIYAGQAVLDISKCLMYDFWYNYLKRKYGKKCTLLMTDTDSLLFHVETSNIFMDMYEHSHLFDTSNFAEDNFCHSDVNKRAVGKFKSETGSKIITKFAGLRSKMYSFTVEEGDEQKRAKGVYKSIIDKELRYKMFQDTLFQNKELRSEMQTIRSQSHELYIMKVRKKSLSPFDDKRFLINSIESLPYGHYMIDVFSEYWHNA